MRVCIVPSIFIVVEYVWYDRPTLPFDWVNGPGAEGEKNGLLHGSKFQKRVCHGRFRINLVMTCMALYNRQCATTLTLCWRPPCLPVDKNAVNAFYYSVENRAVHWHACHDIINYGVS